MQRRTTRTTAKKADLKPEPATPAASKPEMDPATAAAPIHTQSASLTDLCCFCPDCMRIYKASNQIPPLCAKQTKRIQTIKHIKALRRDLSDIWEDFGADYYEIGKLRMKSYDDICEADKLIRKINRYLKEFAAAASTHVAAHTDSYSESEGNTDSDRGSDDD